MFSHPGSSIFVPDGLAVEAAMRRCTHLGVGAHQDDLEFMAYHGILECYEDAEKWFCGVVCTDGAGSARSGRFSGYTNEEMRDVRIKEQEAAAEIGRYGAIIQLGHSSAGVKTGRDLVGDLRKVLDATGPEVVYAHNPADKHGTHIAVFLATIEALRSAPLERRPKRVLGCEVWRDLDWMPDGEKVALDVGGNDGLFDALCGAFQSQIAGGKRYDLAVTGRRRANATFFTSHAVDRAEQLSFAMDLTPLVENEALDAGDYVAGLIERFREDVIAGLKANSPR